MENDMEAGVKKGYIYIWVHRDFIGIMEKKREISILGLYRV